MRELFDLGGFDVGGRFGLGGRGFGSAFGLGGIAVCSGLISDVCDQTHGRHTGKEGKDDDGGEGPHFGLLEKCVAIHDFGCILRNVEKWDSARLR
jgi:hypothetical protein